MQKFSETSGLHHAEKRENIPLLKTLLSRRFPQVRRGCSLYWGPEVSWLSGTRVGQRCPKHTSCSRVAALPEYPCRPSHIRQRKISILQSSSRTGESGCS
ncbi:hypothetical protein BOTBODRAFT_327082 [Botryobasidium botryosum FD-172 SS1]|uniref:PI-PLC Y-box domain-containing protein n=1 Tax=Botryobasidium botryosum (strain FD-172 SS1) TaxID=930990 RepID=A0A067NA81_BOTB1|nr:hypothetical protein BOTBODRAFT_327082 [Botryobasidium botryosum FD-172 SS1]